MYFLKKTLRALFLGALIVYFAMMATMLVVRYVVLPHVNEWRPQIEQRLSSTFGTKVTVGDVMANWSGLNPTLSIQDLSIRNEQGETLLYVPTTNAIVSWRSLFVLDLRLKHLEVNGIDIAINRQVDGNISMAGYVLDSISNTEFKLDSDTLAARWLLGQGKVVVNNATLRWRDLQRGTPELTLTSVDLVLSNGLFSHRLSIHGTAPKSIAQSFELVVRADHLLGPFETKAGRHAEIYLEVQDLAPQALAPWLDLPAISGRFAGRAWIDVQQGKFAGTTLEIVGAKIGAELPAYDHTSAFAQRGRIRLAGLLGDMLPMVTSDLLAVSPGSGGVVDVQASAEGATVDSPQFQPTLVAAQKVDLKMKVNNPHGPVAAQISTLSLSNAHLELNLQGDWQAGGESAAGIANMTGMIVRLSAPELYRYMTVQTTVDVRNWLRDSLVQGEFRQAALTLQGDLSMFPFNLPQEKGIFKIDGQYHDLLLDYGPATSDTKGWPALAYTDGAIQIHQLGLKMQSSSGTLLGAHGERLKFEKLNVDIPDMGMQPLLSIDMSLQSEAGLLLNVLRETPVNEKVGGLFSELTATGNLLVPLSIRADLNDMDKLHSKGHIVFSGGNLSWGEAWPELEGIQGNLMFATGQIDIDKLQAKFLGEPLTISGSLGPSSAKGIAIDGILPIAALSKLTQAPALSVLDGRTRYKALVVQNNKEGVDVTVNSGLDGLSIALPEPLGKTKETSLPLNLKWSTTKQRQAYRQSVSFSLGEIINGKLERQSDARTKTFFTQAAFAMGSAAVLPASGMTIDLSLGEIDWAHWKDLSDKLSSEKIASAKRTNNLLPQVQNVAIRTPRLIFDDLIFTNMNVKTTQAEKGQWSARIDSEETAGSIGWQESSGALAGRVVAKFTKLALGSAPTDEEQAPKIQSIDDKQWSDIPAVDLTIDDFTLFGSRLGSLRLIGANTERGSIWSVDNLEIKNPHSTMNATGLWRLTGTSRGVKLKAELVIADLGKLTTFMGYPDKVRGGSGKVNADIDWANFPWAFSYAGMAGTADIEMKDGVFVHVNSRSARLLELLSLQSLQRILSFNFKPTNEFQNGFPWESISGKFLIDQGVAKTENLTIASPVASILLVGDSDLSRKTWNMNADVKPRFDMSGTALATGFVVNPIVGVSALVTQFLLRNPIERAMTAKYQVRGPWDDPTLIPLDLSVPKAEGLTMQPGPGN